MKATKNSTPVNFIDPVFARGTSHSAAETPASFRQYRYAIEALDLDEKEKARYMDVDQMDRFRLQLETRLRKTKLWNYAPHQRDAVKEARAYLQEMLGLESSYQ